MTKTPVLQATPAFGLNENRLGKAATRFAIQNLVDETVWTGEYFSPNWEHALLYADANQACGDMRKIMMHIYEGQRFQHFTAPVRVEVFGEADMLNVQKWLSRAALLKLRNDDYGNGPGNALVIPSIHWAEMEELHV